MTAVRHSVDASVASLRIPTRLIYCVDGTYCTPDGIARQVHGNISNVYRIYASVKRGLCFDETKKKEFKQRRYTSKGSAPRMISIFSRKRKRVYQAKGIKK